MLIKNVTELDTATQSFAVLFQIELSWTDFSCAGARTPAKDPGSDDLQEVVPGSFSSHVLEIDGTNSEMKHWAPRLRFTNQIGTTENPNSWYKIYEAETRDDPAVVCFRASGLARFQQTFDLRNFPFDLVNPLCIHCACNLLLTFFVGSKHSKFPYRAVGRLSRSAWCRIRTPSTSRLWTRAILVSARISHTPCFAVTLLLLAQCCRMNIRSPSSCNSKAV